VYTVLCAQARILVNLFKEVLQIDLAQIAGIEWAAKRERISVVFSLEEIMRILVSLSGSQKLIASLLYGSGLRLAEDPELIRYARRVM